MAAVCHGVRINVDSLRETSGMPAPDKPLRPTHKSDWSTFWPTLWVTLIGTVLVGGAVAIGVAWVSAEIQRGIAEEAASIATCENPQHLRLLTGADASATSQLEYTDVNNVTRSYPAQNLVDGSRQTAWIAAEENSGIGTTITLDLSAERDVRLICILNGYAKSSELYESNGSVRVLQVTSAQGVRDAALPRVTDANIFEYQSLVFAPGNTQRIELEVQAADVPEASREFGPSSASISEIEVWVRDD